MMTSFQQQKYSQMQQQTTPPLPPMMPTGPTNMVMNVLFLLVLVGVNIWNVIFLTSFHLGFDAVF